jgi:hypothetical protein
MLYAHAHMAIERNPDHRDAERTDLETEVDNSDFDEALLGEVPDGVVGADLYPRHLEHLSRQEEFSEAVLSFPDADGVYQDVSLDEVESTEKPADGSSRGKILLRNGAIVVASGAVIAGALATVRYRRKHRS